MEYKHPEKFIGKYESIFDHLPTEEELEFISHLAYSNPKYYLENYINSKFMGYFEIGMLYTLRGNKLLGNYYKDLFRKNIIPLEDKG